MKLLKKRLPRFWLPLMVGAWLIHGTGGYAESPKWSDEALACMANVKSQFKDFSLKMANIADPDVESTIQEINNDPSYTQNRHFILKFADGKSEANKLALQGHSSDSSSIRGMMLGLEVSDDLDALFAVSIRAVKVITNYPVQTSIQIMQNLIVDHHCQLSVTNTEKDVYHFDGKIDTIDERIVYTNGRAQSVETYHTRTRIPKGGNYLYDVLQFIGKSELEQFTQRYRSEKLYTPESHKYPWLTVTLRPDTFDANIAGRIGNYSGTFLDLSLDGNVLDTSGLFFDTSNSDALGKNDSNSSILVSEADWLSNSLANRSKFATLSAELEPDALMNQTPLEIEIKTKLRLGFPNINKYWDIQKKTDEANAPDGFVHTLRARSQAKIDYSNSAPLIKNPQASNDRYLGESLFVQISAPQVQVLIARLKAGNPGPLNRAEMARKIVEFIPSVLKFDNTMIDDGAYKFNINTTDILKRGKAVCQQYVNLFTALARGLGIPARPVSGFNFFGRNGVGFHAWNEIEIRKGVWLPVEPQDPGMDFDPSKYFPLFIDPYERHPFRGEMSFIGYMIHPELYKIKILKSSNSN